jgi:hypothetical protein
MPCSHNHTTVNVERLTSDVGGCRIEGKELHQTCYLVWLSVSAKRDGSHDLCLDLGAKLSGHVRCDEPGGDGVAVDLAASILTCDGFGEADDTGLSSGVVGLAGVACDAHDGGDVDDAPTDRFLLAHHFGALLAHHKHTGEVGVDHFLPLRHLHAHHEGVPGDARVVDNHVYLTERVHRLLHETLDVVLVANVGLDTDGVAAGCLDLLRDLLGRACRSGIVDNNARPRLAKSERDGGTDAAGSTSDNAYGTCVCLGDQSKVKGSSCQAALPTRIRRAEEIANVDQQMKVGASRGRYCRDGSITRGGRSTRLTSRVPSAEAVVAKARRVAVTGVAARRGFTAVPKVARCLSDLTAVRETAAAAEVIQAAMLFDVLRGQKGGGKREVRGGRVQVIPLSIDH